MNTITQQSKISLALVGVIVGGVVAFGGFIYSIKSQQDVLQAKQIQMKDKVQEIDKRYVTKEMLNTKLDSIQTDITYIKKTLNRHYNYGTNN